MTAAASDVGTLEVYLVPVGTANYELYCETPDDDEPDDGPAGRSASSGLYARFREMMEEAQEARRTKRLAALPDPRVAQSWTVRLRNWVVSWVAEAIADWRLLWRLRTRRDATLLHPADLTGAAALDIARLSLQRDANRHRIWLIIDGVLAGILGLPFTLIPGPNLIAYYFVFRSVGHLLAWRGACNGHGQVVWHTRHSPPLGDLRRILSLDPDERARHVRNVEARLELEHLAAFIERIVVRSTHPTKDA